MIKSTKNLKLLLLAGLLLIWANAQAQPKVILKLDDLGSKNGITPAAPVLDYLMAAKIKTAFGVIAVKLDPLALKAYAKYIDARNDNGEKLFEVWHHGLTHSKNDPPGNDKLEFKGTSYEFQHDHFNKAESIVLQLLKVQMHTFGSPYNAIDSNTEKVFTENKNYKVFLLDGGKSFLDKGILHMNNRVNMEVATGKPNYEAFVKLYHNLAAKYPDFIVLQGHPNG